jgi:hypothetical protein
MTQKYDRFQGDPAVFIDENGAYMKFKGGQPVMDQGLENPVKISHFTKQGWWGNVLVTEESKKIGSDYEEVAAQPITVDSPSALEEASAKAMDWMIKTGLAKFETSVTNTNDARLDTKIIIETPGKVLQEFLLTKNGLFWKAQAEYPANERE